MNKNEAFRKENIANIIALTPLQEGMLFHYLTGDSENRYFEQLSLNIRGKIEKPVFQRAWNILVETNEMLRTLFRWENVNNPVQIVLKKHTVKPEYYDLSDGGESEKQSEKTRSLEKIRTEDRAHKFDLRDVPFRVILCKIEEERYELIISNHHILFDGWSTGIILKEFFTAYNALKNEALPEKRVKTPFKRFVLYLQGRDKNREEDYWKAYLKGLDSRTEMSIKKRREETGSEGSEETDNYGFVLEEDLVEKLEGVTKRYKITTASLLYVSWGMLQQKYNNCDDVVFGTTVSGRGVKIKGIEDMVGLFINTIPLRVTTRPGEKAADLLRRVHRGLQKREEYESGSLVKIKEYSEIDGNEELFDSIVVIENYPLAGLPTGGRGGLVPGAYSMFEATHYDMTVGFTLFDGIRVNLSYNRARFHKETVEGMAGHLLSIFHWITGNPDQSIEEFEILSDKEKRKLLVEFNGTAADYPRDKTIHQLFEEQAERTPDSIAVHWADSADMTYSELNNTSNRWAHRLWEKGVQPGDIVAILMERSIEMLIGIFAVLKAGAAYLPMDPEYPEERRKYILTDSNARVLLSELSGELPTQPTHPTHLTHLTHLTHPTHLAYIIYTSGSTGKPKGVAVEHRSPVNLLYALQETYPLKERDTYLLKTAYTFDVSVTELFGWFLGGGGLAVLEKNGEKDPQKIIEAVENFRVTHINFVPSMFNVFVDELNARNIFRLSRLKYIFLAGEALLPGLVNKFSQLGTQIRLENIYGPTEAAVYASRYSLSRWSGHGPVPIGKPMQNMNILILDRHGFLSPIGVPGELNISGAGVARGYLNNPELTARVFYKSYKTGDLARWLPSGNIEYLGRLDHQVKIRGFRVELGEIENRLLAHEDIKEAVVIVKEVTGKENRLHACIVSGKTFDLTELRDFLAKELPGYMIPAHFVQLEKIPLTPSGKVDRTVLAESGNLLGTGLPYVSPGNELEKSIAAVWKELLQLEKVGVNDNFFDIGGNSLSMIRLNGRLKKLLKKDIPMVTLFNYPTITSLARHLSGEPVVEEPVEQAEVRETKPEIAVIGMSGRFPGAQNIGEFWGNIKNGVESITFFSPEELSRMGVDPRSAGDPDYVPVKGVLEGIETFDSSFFGYTPTEAEIMDPQMRIFHECCWDALEDAAYDPDSYHGVIGLYAGAGANPYWEIRPLVSGSGGYSEQWNAVQFSDKDYLSTRIGYKLNLKGPCVTMQTACSTSLVAVELAVRSLIGGGCQMALAGGVSVTFHDKAGYYYQEGTIMSPDGHCRAFDAGARGTVGGNGAGVVVLKPLEDALRDRDNIYAVIKGAAINNDGKNKAGFTAPGTEGQANVIRAARRMAGFPPETITYIEAHGTGTNLGDPIEIDALKKAFNTRKTNYCALGSVKTNIGHLDAAAGIAGLIKTVLALEHRMIPPGLHFKEPNPAVDFENSPFYVNTRLSPWTNENFPLRAGVSSFGLGGTNAHILLEEAPNRAPSGAGRDVHLILLSAKTETGLEKKTGDLVNYFDSMGSVNPGSHLADAAYTLQVGRPAFPYRRTAVCADIHGAAGALSSAGSFLPRRDNIPVVFMFSGQGSQYADMGLDLYRSEPRFRENMDRGFQLLKFLTGENVKEILHPPSGSSDKLHDVIYSGPVKFLFEYSLAKLMMSWGIRPQALIGHSFGEYVAACLSGVFSFEDGLKMAVLRGTLMEKTAPGAMLSVPLSEEDLAPLLFKHPELSLAAVNSPALCIVSGPPRVVEGLETELNEKGNECIRINFPRASHSKLMVPVLAEFEEGLRNISFSNPTIPYISGLTGTWITHREAVDPAYWTRHLKETIRFSDGLKQLMEEPDAVFVEVGPGRGLTLFLERNPDKKEGHLPLNLVRHRKENVSDVYYTLSKLGELWSYGANVDWGAFHGEEKRYRIPLPTYPFEKSFYPVDPGLCKIERRNRDAPLEKKPGIKNWFYTPSWKRLDLSITTQTPGTGDYLVFADDTGIASQLEASLRDDGHVVVSVRAGSGFKRITDTEYTINPQDGTGYALLFDQLKRTGKTCNKIIHCWGITNRPPDEFDYENIDPVLDLGFFSLFYMAKALGKLDGHKKQIVVITNHIQEVTGEEELSPLKSTVLGAVKVLPGEYPQLSCRGIDITGTHPDHRFRETLIPRLLEEIYFDSADFADPVVALRGNHRWVQTYEARPLEKPRENSLLKKGGVYLITGGLGGIGLTLASFLAKNYRAKLVLVGRTASPGKENAIREILGAGAPGGAEVMIRAADVSDFSQMRDVVSRAEDRFGPVNGIVHAAGVPGGGMIEVRTREEIRDVLSPKVNGTLVLNAVFKDAEPDFFVLCSSLSSVTAPFAQSGYCAANIFLDTFAHQKNISSQNKTRTLSINWNTWKEVGMAANAIKELEKTYRGLQNNVLFDNDILPAGGVDVFASVLPDTRPQVLVSSYDLERFVRHVHKTEERLRRDLSNETGFSKTPERVGRKRPDIGTVYAAPRGEVENILCGIWQDLFGIDRAGTNDDFFQLGGDSLKAVIVSSKIHKTLDVKIPLSHFFSNPTIKELSRYINKTNKKVYAAVKPAEKKEYFFLSSAQKRMYVLYRMDKTVTSYNIPSVLSLTGELDVGRFEDTFTALIKRHESFRTAFEEINGEPVQKIRRTVAFTIEYVTVPGEGGPETEEDIIKRFIRPFDLSRPPLLRIGLIKTGEKSHLLLIDLHHIVSDGTSVGILINEFMGLYEGNPLPALTLQYKDYSEWQSRERNRGAFEQQEAYWLERFSGEIPPLDIPTDFPRPDEHRFEGRTLRFTLNRELTAQLTRLATAAESTLSIVLSAAYTILLSKYTHREDIILGTSIAGRTHPDMENIIGMFVNMLAMRNYPREEISFMAFLREVNAGSLAAYDNQDYQFEELVDKLGLERKPGRHPLVDTVLAVQNLGLPDIEIPGLTLKPYEFENNIAHFDLLLTAAVGAGTIDIGLEYSIALFKESTAQRILNHYIEILHQVVRDRDTKLNEITITHELLSAESDMLREDSGDFGF